MCLLGLNLASTSRRSSRFALGQVGLDDVPFPVLPNRIHDDELQARPEIRLSVEPFNDLFRLGFPERPEFSLFFCFVGLKLTFQSAAVRSGTGIIRENRLPNAGADP